MGCWDHIKAFGSFMALFTWGMIMSNYYVWKAVILFFIPKCLRFKDVSKETVLITGGASGLGRLFALRFAKLGANVVIWDMNMAGLEETTKMVDELRSKAKRDGKVGRCFAYQVDISSRFNVYAAADRVKQEVGDVTMVINNAGVVTGRRFLECRDEQIIKSFDVNALAHFWILKAFLPSMQEKNHGHLVTIASIAGIVGAYQLPDYSASKFAAVGLEESLRLELHCDGYDGIHSTVVCPYYINTGMFAGVGKSLIPVLSPEYVVDETIKAIRVNQEVLCLPDIVYWLCVSKATMPTMSFMWGHRAIGAAGSMKSFTGRGAANPQTREGAKHTPMSMAPNDVGITMPNHTLTQ